MKKKFISNISKDKLLPLPLYFIEAEGIPSKPTSILKLALASKIKSKGYPLTPFYKPISKF